MFDHILAVDLRGAFLDVREVGRPMLEQGSGSIVNITSMNADTAPMVPGGYDGVTPRPAQYEALAQGIFGLHFPLPECTDPPTEPIRSSSSSSSSSSGERLR